MSNLGIFSLPKYVVLPILIEWLAMNELGSLDCAVCNVHLRKLFLMWIGGSEIAFSGTIHEKYNGQLYWQWLSLRDIPVYYISVYFQKFDHIVVRPKSFWERAYDNLLGQSSTLIVSKGDTPINLKLPLKLNSLFICAMENDHTRYLFPLTAQRLVSLKLTHFSVDVEEYVSEICNFMEKQYPSLKELIIQDCDPIPERVVLNVLRDCSELSHLFLVQRTSPNYKYVSPSVMRTVCQSWPDCFKLNTLSLCRLNDVCDELLLNLLPKCPLLQHIMIIECRITDRSVFLIAQTCSSVISIALEPLDQYRITGSPILAIAAYCKELEYWNVVQSSAEVRDFQIMIEECPKLRFLCCGYSRYNFTHHLKTRPHLRIEPDARLSGWFEPYPYTLPPSGK